MRTRLIQTFSAVCLALLASIVAHAEESADCSDQDQALNSIIYSPWPTQKFSWSSSLDTEVRISDAGYRTEAEILEYFTLSEMHLPSIRSKAAFGNREVGLRTRLCRSWTFPGLKLDGFVDARNVYLDSAILESTAYPLKCGLGVGAPSKLVAKILGQPVSEPVKLDEGRIREMRYDGIGDDHKVVFEIDDDGVVKRIRWELPSGHRGVCAA